MGGFLSHCLTTFNVVLEPLCLICSKNHYMEDGFELWEESPVCILCLELSFGKNLRT